MITKAQIQFVRSLEQKKVRDETGLFIAEGDKMVREALALPSRSNYQVKTIYGIESWLLSNEINSSVQNIEVVPLRARDLERISFLRTPNQVLAIISRNQEIEPLLNFESDLLLGLDQVQDPGNLGTIIRLADWFGLGGIIASMDSADFFSPKVVQASMGSVFRVKLVASDLVDFIRSLPTGFPVYGTHLDGENLYSANITPNGLILLGNESRGMKPLLKDLSMQNLRIPGYSTGETKPESLNVSIAAAILCSEFRRRKNG